MTNSNIRVVDETFTPAEALVAEIDKVLVDVPQTLSIETDWNSIAGQRVLTLAGQARSAGVDDETLDALAPGLSDALGR